MQRSGGQGLLGEPQSEEPSEATRRWMQVG
jgi:hypothetical protein